MRALLPIIALSLIVCGWRTELAHAAPSRDLPIMFYYVIGNQTTTGSCWQNIDDYTPIVEQEADNAGLRYGGKIESDTINLGDTSQSIFSDDLAENYDEMRDGQIGVDLFIVSLRQPAAASYLCSVAFRVYTFYKTEEGIVSTEEFLVSIIYDENRWEQFDKEMIDIFRTYVRDSFR